MLNTMVLILSVWPTLGQNSWSTLGQHSAARNAFAYYPALLCIAERGLAATAWPADRCTAHLVLYLISEQRARLLDEQQ